MKKGIVFYLLLSFFIFAWGFDSWADNKKDDDKSDGSSSNAQQSQGQAQGQGQIQVQGQSQGQTQRSSNRNTLTNSNAITNSPTTTNTLTNNPTVNVTNSPVISNTQGSVTNRNAFKPTNTNTVIVNVPGQSPAPPHSSEPIAAPKEDITVSSSSQSAATEIGDTGSFRQFPEPAQPVFPSLKDGGKDANWRVLDYKQFIWLPKRITPDLIQRTNMVKCDLAIYPYSERIWNTDQIMYSHEGTIYDKKIKGARQLVPDEFEIVGLVLGSCPKGDTVSLHLQISEAGMLMGGDVITYLQTGKGEKPSAWSIGLFGGGVAAQLGGQSKDKSISVSGGLGLNYGTATINEFPGAIAAILELKDWALVK